jgi:hypothetical protein
MRQSARMLRDKTVLLNLNNIIIITLNLPSSQDTMWFVCVCASRINLPTQSIMLTILNALSLACAELSIGSMQVSFPILILDRSSCEGIVRPCWILAENEGCQWAESTTKSVLFRGDGIELDPPHRRLPNDVDGRRLQRQRRRASFECDPSCRMAAAFLGARCEHETLIVFFHL